MKFSDFDVFRQRINFCNSLVDIVQFVRLSLSRFSGFLTAETDALGEILTAI
jgi:hypothetical protein